MKTNLIPVLLVLALGATASAQRIYVDANVATSGDGTTWALAFKTLQPALASAQPGAQVWVATGTYTGGFTVPAGVAVLAGFAPGALRDLQQVPSLNRVTLDGGGTQRVLTLGNQCVVDGLVVQNGSAGAPGGGGALVDGTAPLIRNCIFRLNTNTAGDGSALLVRNQGDPRVENCVFYQNGSATSGHAVDLVGARGLFLNDTFHNNFNDGLHFRGGSTPRICNSIFAENGARGVTRDSASDVPVALESSLFYNNALALCRDLGQDLTTIAQVNALSYAKNNLAGDPLFVSIGANDFRLQAGSPCVDAGSTTFVPPSPFPMDPAGNSRLSDGNLDGTMRIDIGAYEFSNISLTVSEHSTGGHVHARAAGTAGLPFVLVLTAGTIPALPIAPFGYWFLDPAVFLVMGNGAIPLTLTINTPLAPPMILNWQAFALGTGGAGNLSNPVVMRIN